MGVLDTGATNHMIGAISAFLELDSEIRGTVKFGDGSIVEIEGSGTILFIISKEGCERWASTSYRGSRLTL